MSMPFQVANNAQLGGKTFGDSRQIACDVAIPVELSVPAAVSGTLSVRTDANTGTLVMASGAHGITTSSRIDLYWTEAGVMGCRRGVTAGTVSGTSVPIDLGSGDDLPTAAETIIVGKCVSQDVVVVGDNVQALAAASEARGQVVIADGSDAELANFNFPLAAQSDSWYKDNGKTNPLASDTVGKVFFSHADTTKANLMRVGFGYN